MEIIMETLAALWETLAPFWKEMIKFLLEGGVKYIFSCLVLGQDILLIDILIDIAMEVGITVMVSALPFILISILCLIFVIVQCCTDSVLPVPKWEPVRRPLTFMLPALGQAQQCGELDPKCAPILKASGAEIQRIGKTIGDGDSMRSSMMKTACAAQVGVDAVDACIAVSSPSCAAILEAEKENMMPTLRTAIEGVRKLSSDDDANWEPDKAKCKAFGQAGNAGLAGLLDSLEGVQSGLDDSTGDEAGNDAAIQAEYDALMRELEALSEQTSRLIAERYSVNDKVMALKKTYRKDQQKEVYRFFLRQWNDYQDSVISPTMRAMSDRYGDCGDSISNNERVQFFSGGISNTWSSTSSFDQVRHAMGSDFIGNQGVSSATEWANFSLAQRVVILRNALDGEKCSVSLNRELVALDKAGLDKLQAIARMAEQQRTAIAAASRQRASTNRANTQRSTYQSPYQRYHRSGGSRGSQGQPFDSSEMYNEGMRRIEQKRRSEQRERERRQRSEWTCPGEGACVVE